MSSDDGKKGFCFVISAPSGSGKTTAISRAIERLPFLEFVVSCTTRKPRPGEVDGKHYHFVSVEKFEAMIASGEFLEWAKVHDNFYGTPKQSFSEILNRGGSAILEIDVQGARQVTKAFPEAVSICILPTSPDALRKRLKSRGVDSETEIKRRLQTARAEIIALDSYNYLIINDDLDEAVEELISVVIAERCRFEYRLPLFRAWQDSADESLK